MSILTQAVTRLLLAPAIVVAIALLVKGYVGVGDGFSAGVVVTLAIALQYLTFGKAQVETEIPLLRHAPRVAIAGILIALFTGFFPVVYGEPIFSHLPPPGESTITVGTLKVITAMLFDIGIFLLITGSMIAMIQGLAEPPEVGDEVSE